MKNKMGRKKVIILFFTTVLLLGLILALSLLSNKDEIKFTLTGKDLVTLEVNEKYIEDGYKLEKCSSKKCEEIKEEIVIDSDLDTSKVGSYEIVYKYIADKEYVLKRTVKVIDSIAPVIELKGNRSANVCPNKEYVEEGYSASDNYDGIITDNVEVIKEKDKTKYRVLDSSNNETVVTRKINYTDSVKPVIVLNGKDVSLKYGQEYKEPGFKATDNCDGVLTSEVKVTNNINSSKPGKYTVTYEVKDTSGNNVTVKRTVTVKEKVTVVVEQPDNTDLTTYIKKKGYRVSVGYYDLETGFKYTYNANKVYYGASLIKTLDALYIYNKTSVSDADKKLVSKAISVSDNGAHQKLVKEIGRENLK